MLIQNNLLFPMFGQYLLVIVFHQEDKVDQNNRVVLDKAQRIIIIVRFLKGLNKTISQLQENVTNMKKWQILNLKDS